MRSLKLSTRLLSKTREMIGAGASIIIHAPRFYYRREFARELVTQVTELFGLTPVQLSLKSGYMDSDGSYPLLWDSLKKQARLKSRAKVVDLPSFAVALRGVSSWGPHTFLFVIDRPSDMDVGRQVELVATIHAFKDELHPVEAERFQLLVLDDYSIYYREALLKMDVSMWNLQRVHYDAFEPTDISLLFTTNWKGIDPKQVEMLSERIAARTGGHPGLTVELLSSIKESGCMIPTLNDSDIDAMLSRSSVIDTLRQALAEEAASLVQVALDYSGAKILGGNNSFALQRLRQMGIVHWTSATRAILYPGIINELVHEVFDSGQNDVPLGTLVAELGPRVYDSGAEHLVADDDDLVVVHLSDLHLSEGFPFKLKNAPNRGAREDRESLHKLLGEDIKRLGLAGRIDLLIISGDFTEGATMAEFMRAREVLQDVMKELGVGPKQILITAGNHDVTWKPDPLAEVQAISSVSREHNAVFRELLGLDPNATVDIVEVVSRSGCNTLRVVSLDSNFVEGPAAAGIGFVKRGDFEKAEELINASGSANDSRAYTWLVTHHHVLPGSSHLLTDINRAKFTLMGNAPAILDFATSIRAEAILHGHEHQPSVTVARRWPADPNPDFQPLVVIGAGSVSAARSALGPFSKNQYYILYRKPGQLLIRSRSTNETGLSFTAHNDLVIPLEHGNASG